MTDRTITISETVPEEFTAEGIKDALIIKKLSDWVGSNGKNTKSLDDALNDMLDIWFKKEGLTKKE